MNTTVWKYPLEIVTEQTIEVPLWTDALTIQMQDRTPCLWVRVDPAEKLVPKKIIMVGTGISELTVDDYYLGTVQLDGFVWHYFEVAS